MSGSLSESQGVCQKVGESVRKLGSRWLTKHGSSVTHGSVNIREYSQRESGQYIYRGDTILLFTVFLFTFYNCYVFLMLYFITYS